MIRNFATVLIVAILFANCKPSKKNNDEFVKQELVQLNNQYDSALIRNDTAILKRLYADEFVYTNPEGKVINRTDQLTSVAISEMKWESGKSEDVKIQVYDDIAVMTGAFRGSGTYRANPVTIYERYTTVWKKTDTSWEIVADQGNIVK